MSDSLFRKEVIKNQGERILGDVILSQPVSHYIYSGFLALVTFIALLFLLLNDYSRKQSVVGFLVPDSGVVSVYPSQTSILNELMVQEGDNVYINTELFRLQIEQGSNENNYASNQILENLTAQESVLVETKIQEELFLQNILVQHENNIAYLQTEIAQLERLKHSHEELSLLEEQSYNRAQLLFTRETISQSDLEDAQKSLLQSTIQLQNINLTLAQNISKLHQSEIDRENHIIRSFREIADIENRISEISKQKVTTHSEKQNIIHSPVSGRITSLLPEIGQRVSPNVPVLSIIPDNSVLEAQLYVPTRAIGFIQIGQTVNIKYDAFPYERFGLYDGTVSKISNSIMEQNELPIDIQLKEPVYKITVSLAQQSITAYSEKIFLKPGLMLSADVILDERSLFEWLMEPLYSLRGTI